MHTFSNILRRGDVERITGLSRSTIYDYMLEAHFRGLSGCRAKRSSRMDHRPDRRARHGGGVMTPSNAPRAVPAAAGDDPRKHDLAGELIGAELIPNLPERQAEHLRRRFLLPAPTARAVAEIHFGRVA